ncbi:DUF2314 domain-containing protein [Gemmata sp.]|uniref:DUF2314 domain-containing protein n=1 Tax=Gemmata sp. TaxID=1914242 RepID=UPI003F702872
MSESDSQNVLLFDNSDPEMQRAYAAARESFRYLWREIARDRQRIVPALGLAAVKAPFTDGPRKGGEKNPEVEHMWLSEIDFDGEHVSGVLVNSPNWLRSVKEGDPARLPIDQISDWMYAISGESYGGFTVNLLRSRMSATERGQHDAAWGLDFGDPSKVRLVTQHAHDSLSEQLAGSLKSHLKENPTHVATRGHNGWTMLHSEASAGSVATVRVLIEAGADQRAVTNNGLTPRQLAQNLGWGSVVELLESRGG